MVPGCQDLSVWILLLSSVALVDGQFEVPVAESADFLLGGFGEGSDVFDEDGDSEVVVETFAVGCHLFSSL